MLAPQPLSSDQLLDDAMTEEELLAAIEDEVNWASDQRDDRAGSGREAIDYFYCRLPPAPSGDDCEIGMSDIVSSDVQDAVYAVCAEIMPAVSGAAPVEFQALDAADEQQAEIETRAVNHVAQSSGLYHAVANAVQDAMLRRAGVVKVFWEDRVRVEYQSLEGVSPEMLPALLQDRPGEMLEIVQGDIDPRTGQASGVLRKHRKRSRPRIDPVPLDEFLISADLATPNVDEARFVAHQRPVSRSELVELGVPLDLVEELDNIESADYRSSVRSRDHLDQTLRSAHESTEYVMVVESYYHVDWDGDGIAERRRIVTAGGSDGTDKLLLNDPWAEQPFAVGVGYLGVYSWDGVSLFDRLKAIQDAKTWIMREVLNTVRRNMRQRIGAVEGDANWDDVLTSQMGGVVRLKTPQGLVTIPDVQLPPTVFNVLEYLDTVRKDKGGGAIDATASAQVLGQGGDWSLERVMAATEQLNAMVAKNLSETLLKPIYRKLHYLLREYQNDPLHVPGTSGWQTTLPPQWNPREEMVITMGMSVGERTTRMGALQQIMQMQAADTQTGMTNILSGEFGVYQARLDMARLAGLPQPEQYFIDPTSPEAMQAKQQKQQAAQQAQAMQIEMQKQTAEFQYKMMTDIERIKADAKLATQHMVERTKALEAQIDALSQAMGHKVKLAEIEQKGDLAAAQQEIDRLQLESDIERGMESIALEQLKIQQAATHLEAKHNAPPGAFPPKPPQTAPAPRPLGMAPGGAQGRPAQGQPQRPMAMPQGQPQRPPPGPPQGRPPQAPGGPGR